MVYCFAFALYLDAVGCKEVIVRFSGSQVLCFYVHLYLFLSIFYGAPKVSAGSVPTRTYLAGKLLMTLSGIGSIVTLLGFLTVPVFKLKTFLVPWILQVTPK
jgi:hypothetical protein